jgi:hypothetical protein
VKQIFQDASAETTSPDESITNEDVDGRFQENYPDQHEMLYNSSLYVNESIIVDDETALFLKNANLNDKIPSVYYFLYQQLIEALSGGDRRIQLEEMERYIEIAVDLAYAESRSRFPNTIEVE